MGNVERISKHALRRTKEHRGRTTAQPLSELLAGTGLHWDNRTDFERELVSLGWSPTRVMATSTLNKFYPQLQGTPPGDMVTLWMPPANPQLRGEDDGE